MRKIFPKINDDGSFVVLVKYSFDRSEPKVTSRDIVVWIDNWIQKASPWVRNWSSGRTEVLDYFDDFAELPLVAGISKSGIEIKFLGKPESIWWKDWYVRFSSDLIAAHSAIIDVESCKSL